MDESPGFPRDPLQLDDGTVDRLLDGLPADDAPPSYRGVAELLSTVRAAPTADDGAPKVSRYFPSPQVTWATAQPPPRKIAPRRGLRRASAALVGCATLFVALGAAGALPGAAQGVASDVLGTVGVSAPNPDAPADVEVHPNSASDAGGSSGSGATDASVESDGATVSGTSSGTGANSGAASASGSSDGTIQAGQHDTTGTSGTTSSSDPADPSDGNNGNDGNGNPSVGNNGNDNGKGNGANNGNAYAGDGNAGNTPPHKP